MLTKEFVGFNTELQGVSSSTPTYPKSQNVNRSLDKVQGYMQAGQSLKNTFALLIRKMADCQVSDRLTTIMKKIGFENRAYSLLISKKRHYLRSLRFNTAVDFDKTVNIVYKVSHNASRQEAILYIPACNPLNSINEPAGATHFRLVNALGIVSDFRQDATTGTFEPIDPINHEKNIVAYSDYLPINSLIESQTIVATLLCDPGLTENNTVIQCIGIEFYLHVGEEFYPFFTGNCLKVVEAF